MVIGGSAPRAGYLQRRTPIKSGEASRSLPHSKAEKMPSARAVENRECGYDYCLRSTFVNSCLYVQGLVRDRPGLWRTGKRNRADYGRSTPCWARNCRARSVSSLTEVSCARQGSSVISATITSVFQDDGEAVRRGGHDTWGDERARAEPLFHARSHDLDDEDGDGRLRPAGRSRLHPQARERAMTPRP